MEVSWPLTPWVVPGLVGTVVAGLSATVAARRRPKPGATALLVLSVAVAWWCLFQVVVISLPTLEAKTRASQLQYLGIATVPLAWLWFAASYTSRRERIRRAWWALLALPEAATLLLAWTNSRHGLVWRRLELIPGDGFAALSIDHGAWFRLHTPYAYALVVVGACLLVISLAESPHNRGKAAAVAAAALFPVAANVLYLLGLAGGSRVDLTPAGFALGGLVLAWSLLRADLLDLPPIAWKRILDAMPDGVLVVDPHGRVLDMNRSAARLLRCRVGDRLDEPLLGGIGDPAGAVEPPREAGPHPVLTVEGRVLEVGRSAIGSAGSGDTLVVVRDVTERERLQGELRDTGEHLVRANEELARLASTDELTGLPNRRQVLSALEQELRRGTRFQHPVGVLLLDVDHFKRINDSLGHGVGDQVLRSVAETLRNSLREVDTVGRLGGDELAIVLPETDAEGARCTAQRLLDTIAGHRLGPTAGADLAVTLSIGLVVAPPGMTDVEDLLHRADLALYGAKAGGRNQLRVASLPEPRDPHPV